ncbi:MAG TPA: ATP-binding protein [Myxococcota bacterium]|nr:ATP-binding protein [Myxococcota bacterium]
MNADAVESGKRITVPPEELAARLKQHRMLGGMPPGELAWLAAHGYVRRFETGDLLARSGVQIEGFHVILSGYFVIYVDRGEGRHKVLEWRGGDVSGQLPYSRMKGSPGDVVIEEPSEILTVPREDLPELIRQCPELTATLVHVMVDRARSFTSSDLHDEKMKSLGKLAAGLAHELNNPASAVVRTAKSLVEGLVEAEEASRAMGAAQLTPVQRAAVDDVRDACLAARVSGAHSPLEEADRVDSISDWLEARGADATVAGPLAETAVTLPALDRLAEALHGEVLNAALRWVAHGCAARSLAREIQTAGSRIYELVAAVKGFTQVDRETTAQPTDVGQGLADTLTVLRAKVKAKSATVTSAVTPGLPPAMAYGGELNQVWLNLIDNALDAVASGGRVDVSAAREGEKLVVRIADDGPGIPSAVLPRIFDPFFTTKPVGQGTGLGLDIVRRLVNRHDGQINVESRPGHTVFAVSLPLRSP